MSTDLIKEIQQSLKDAIDEGCDGFYLNDGTLLSIEEAKLLLTQTHPK